MQVVQVPIENLKPSEYNPRIISDAQLEHLGKSFDEHGFVHPILANSNPKRAFIVISGHQRLRVAKQRGFKMVPTIFIDVDEEQERFLNLRSNRMGGEFDDELLFKHFDIDTLLKQDALEEQMIGIISNLAINEVHVTEKLRYNLKEYQDMTKDLAVKGAKGDIRTQTELFHSYARYLLSNGNEKQKAEFYKDLRIKLQLHDKQFVKMD